MTHGQLRRRALCTLLACALMATAPLASAQSGDTPPEDSAQEFERYVEQARERYEADDLDGAIEAFELAYKADPSEANPLYNIGRMYEKKGEFETAITYYERFVNASDVDINARQDALARIKALREVLQLRKEKTEPVEPDKPAEPVKPVEPVVEPEPIAPAQPEPSRNLALPLTFISLGGTSLVAGGVFAYLTTVSAAEAEDAATVEALRAANQTGKQRAILADSLLVTGGALTTLGFIFLLTSRSEDSPRASVSPLLGPGSAGLGLSLDF